MNGIDPTTQSGRTWRNRNIIGLGLVSFFTDISSEMLYPLTPLFMTSILGASPAIVGMVEGIAEGTASILKTFSGWISDRIGRRKPLIMAGYTMSSAGKPLMAFAFHWWVVLLARFIDRFGKGIRTSARDALIADSCPPHMRGKAYGFHRGMDTLGASIGPLLTIPLLAALGGDLRTVFLLACIPAFIGAALTLVPQDSGLVERSRHRLDLRLAHFPPPFRSYVWIAVVFALANSSDAFLILRAKDTFMTAGNGMSAEQATRLTVFAYALYNLVYAGLSYPAGAASDIIGQKSLLAGGFVVYALVYAGWALAGTVSSIWLLFVAYGTFRALTQGVGAAYAANLAGRERRGTALGIYHGYTGLASVGASSVAGVIWTIFGPPAMFGFDAAVALVAALLLIRFSRGSPQADPS